MLDTYHRNHLDTPNVSLELPTGSGKTLVGLLIAEYRRRKLGERVVYLCPTRQLCHQVKRHAENYGISCSLLVGPQRDYDTASFIDYQRARATAITTYRGLFNTNPRIDDPQAVICDDAHAGEEYIASMWSLDIARHDFPLLYDALVDFLGDAIPEDTRRRIAADSDDPAERVWVDMVPAPLYAERLGDLANLLNEHCHGHGNKLAYSWAKIRGHLEACTMFVSPRSFLFRPYIPPTETHPPFAGATQRVFMSATLGSGGDLERLTGVRKIERLPIPPGWEKRGTGRRLMLFPDLLGDAENRDRALQNVLRSPHRTLVLVKDNREIKDFSERYGDGLRIVQPHQVEHDLHAFLAAPLPAALVFANRYEGVDLPGDACRQMIMVGAPSATNLQERFLIERLGATAQLRDRVRTRITQGVGRCTRDENDYAAVLLVGGDLLKWCSTTANIAGMHPELQAEIDFGFDNSSERTVAELEGLIKEFLSQRDARASVNDDIIERREERHRALDPEATALEVAVEHELSHVYALWRRDFEKAFAEARAAISALSGGSELRPYRTFWHYMAATAAEWAWCDTGNRSWQDNFRDEIDRAVASTSRVPWLTRLRWAHGTSADDVAAPTPIPVMRINKLLEDWQISGRKFDRKLREAREAIFDDSAKPFERGLAILGRMLGFDSHTFDEDGAPDGLWRSEDSRAIVFEAKSNEDAAYGITLDTISQASMHATWVREKGFVAANTEVHTVLISPRQSIQDDARTVAGDIRYLLVADVRGMFSEVAALLHDIRARARGLTEERLLELIEEKYRTANLAPDNLQQRLLAQQVRSLPSPPAGGTRGLATL